MDTQTLYAHLRKEEKETVYAFIMRTLLMARRSLKIKSSKPFFDEDVNVYLAHLLLSICDPSWQEQNHKYVSTNDTDLFERIRHTNDNSLKYCIYKVNADNILIRLGIFQNLGEGHNIKDTKWGRTEAQYICKAKIYYEFASLYNQRIYGKSSAESQVLEKLSRWLERYLRILSIMRNEYLDFIEKISDKQFKGFLDQLKCYEVLIYEEKQDDFLDTYSEWLKTKKEGLKTKVASLAKELHAIDSSFQFDFPDS